jgi:hypothetical protein
MADFCCVTDATTARSAMTRRREASLPAAMVRSR